MLSKWYVINTKPRSEQIVCRQLETKDLEFFFPKMVVTKKRRTTKAAVLEPVFPGYVFVRMIANPDAWSGLNWTPGVKKVLDFNGAPSAVPDGLIDALKKRMEKRGFIQPRVRFHAGDEVRVKDGSFWGLVGVVEEARSGKERVKILIDMLHYYARVEIDAGGLEMVQHKSKIAANSK